MSSQLPIKTTSISIRNTLKSPEAFIENLYTGKNNHTETIVNYIERRLASLTQLESRVDNKLRELEYSIQTKFQEQQQKIQNTSGNNGIGWSTELNRLEQRVQQLEAKPGSAGESGKPGIPGPQGPQGKTGPRGLRGPTGSKRLSELNDVLITPEELKDGSILAWNAKKASFVPVVLEEE